MKYEYKQRIKNYLENGGDEKEKQALLKIMDNELSYADLGCMAVCTDDEGCSDLTMEQLINVADKMEDRLMEDFNSTLGDVINELGY